MIKNEPSFLEFLKLDCDRKNFIQNYLNERNIETTIVTTGVKNHILVRFPQRQYDPIFKIKTIIAHYDRVPETKGANDNSFSVFMLMNWAEKLSKLPYVHNIRIIFTDGEETVGGIKNQGAFALAEWFKKIQIDKGDVFVFDCMGRGDIPILCQTDLPGNLSNAFRNNFVKLEKKSADLLASCSNKWLSLPTSYSDNAGFLAAGIPAVTISMLPSKEAENYMKLLMKTKAKIISDVFKPEFKEELKTLFPPTWFLINSHRDTPETLTEESEEIFLKILEKISMLRTLS